MTKDNYINRFVSSVKNDANFINIDEMKIDNTLYEIIKEQHKVFLLGSPGSGKSTELKILFDTYWDEKEITGSIPFLIDLKLFRKTTSFDDLIPYKDWEGLPNIIFLLDSLDEIADVQDFISELELFIMNNSKRDMKFVIACRSNIYNSHFINIKGFEAYQLQELNSNQIRNLLLQYVSGEEVLNKILTHDRTPFMNSPFFLSKLGELLNENKVLPKTEKEIWELYVNSTLDKQVKKDIKKGVNIPKMIFNLIRTAFVNELQQRSSINESELYKLLSDDYRSHLDNPFFKQNSDKTWSFKHRQFQEYFVAKALSDLNFERLIDVLMVKGQSKVHPTLFNVASFLMSVINKDALRTQLIDWFISHDIDPLIKADPERISKEVRQSVFQSYFTDQCINKRLWISTNNSFSIDELGRFSNCKENSSFLITLILNINNHFRVRGSALNILSFHDLFNKSDLAEKYLELLNLEENVFSLTDKSNLIRSIYDLRLDKVDGNIIHKVIDIFKNESHKGLNSAILNLLTLNEDIDQYFEYLKMEFYWSHDITQRKEMDDVHRGNSYKVNNLILKLKDSSSFAELASYFYDHYQVKATPEFSDKLLEKIKEFNHIDDNFVIELIRRVEKNVGPRNHHNEELLVSAINETNSNFEAFKTIYAEDSFYDRKWLLARIADEGSITFLLDNINEPEELRNDLKGFRNILSSYRKHDLAHYFIEKLKGIGIEFDDSFPNEEEYKEIEKSRIKRIQDDFELLFNKPELIEKVTAHFNSESITLKEAGYLRNKYFENPENYHSDTTSDIDALFLLLRENDGLKKSEVLEELNKDATILKLIRDKLEIRKNRKDKFNFDLKKNEIEKIVESVSSELSLNDLFTYKDINSFNYRSPESYQAYQTLKVLHYFLDSEVFSPSFSDDFLINSMEYYRIEEYDESNKQFSDFIELIGDVELRNKKIVENIKKGIFSFSWKRHVIYALNNNLSDAFSTIREFILNDHSLYSSDKLFELYLEKTNDDSLLEEFACDLSVRSGWTALEIILEKEVWDKQRIVELGLKYLSSEANTEFISNAIRVLFECNNENAFTYYMKYMEDEGVQSRGISRIKHYDAVKEENFPLLIQFFNKIHEQGRDKFEFSYHNELLLSIINNISSDKEAYEKLVILFKKFKEDVLKGDPELKIDLNDSKIFYANLILDNMEKSYISALSKPFTFEEALAKTNEILPLI